MSTALYRKYRSKSLDELVGQEHITKTLANALKSGKLSHAYLLTGPRGVGKTSIARILAFAVNDLPYDEAGTHLDIIEIDAASNRRIDEIRDLRDKVHILPASAKYKVYIIDEVHMLTREAFNALLKTLEEPPAHVIFILATTEAHKLPETIISRTQHFAFRPIDSSVAQQHLKAIAKSEKIDITDEAIALIVEHGRGSFRDSISLLDQARHISSHIVLSDVEQLLGLAPAERLEGLFEALEGNSTKHLLETITELQQAGYQSAQIAKQLSEKLRAALVAGKVANPSNTISLLERLLEVAGSTQPDRLFEVILLGHVLENTPQAQTNTQPVAPPPPSQTVKPPVTPSAKPAAIKVTAANAKPPAKPVAPDEPDDTAVKADPSAKLDGDFTIELWPTILSHIKKQYNTVYGILRMAQPSLEGNTLTLSFKFAFHEKQINQKKNRALISDIIHRETGSVIVLTCRVASKTDESQPAKPSNKAVESASLDTVSNIFGGAEVLES